MLCSYLAQAVSYSSPAKYCSCNLSVEPFICTCLHCICIVLTKVKVLPERQTFYSCTELLNSTLALSDSTKLSWLSWIPFSLTLMLHSMLLLCLHLNTHTHTKWQLTSIALNVLLKAPFVLEGLLQDLASIQKSWVEVSCTAVVAWLLPSEGCYLLFCIMCSKCVCVFVLFFSKKETSCLKKLGIEQFLEMDKIKFRIQLHTSLLSTSHLRTYL